MMPGADSDLPLRVRCGQSTVSVKPATAVVMVWFLIAIMAGFTVLNAMQLPRLGTRYELPYPPSSLVGFFLAIFCVTCALLLLLVHHAFRDESSLEFFQRIKAKLTVVALISTLANAALGIASSGGFLHFPMFPAYMLFMTVMTTLGATTRESAWFARRLPCWMLVGFHGFRLPVEIFLHSGVASGIVPPQLTWSWPLGNGQNVDVYVALLALVLGAWAWFNQQAGRPDLPTAVLWGFGVLGLAALANILRLAVLSMPGSPLLRFPEHTIAPLLGPPFILLPLILVQFAIGGQLLILRRAWDSGSAGASSAVKRTESASML